MFVKGQESMRQQLAESEQDRLQQIDAKAQFMRELNVTEEKLAAALVACKMKDEALLLSKNGSNLAYQQMVQDALAIQPDDSALKVWLGDPVAYLDENYGFMRCGNVADSLSIGTQLYAPKREPK